jgi:Zn-dependent alcohol dehydrogenase
MRRRARSHVNYAFEAIGVPTTVRQAVRITRKGGNDRHSRGGARGNERRVSGGRHRAAREVGPRVHDGVEPFPLRHPRYLELYLSSQLKLDEIITASLPRERINDDWRMFFTIGGDIYVLRATTPHST